jgi:hypothetical protein
MNIHHGQIALSEPARSARTARKALDNARHVGELAVAATAVIDTRTRQMGAAIGDPVALAAPEFTLMVTEKVKAAALSGRAMQRRLPMAMQASLTWIERQAAVAGEAALAPWQARSPVDLLGFGPRAILAGVDAYAALAAEMTHLGTQVFGAGLAPIHRAATRNARRLAR